MPEYTFSKAADQDLTSIYRYTFREFGEARADAYFDSLNDLLDRLAANSRLGREIGSIRAGYRRHAHQRHVVYYKPMGGGIHMVRILGDQ